jgi:hypothetical protein
MTLLRYEYFALSCNAKVNNLVNPTCRAESEGVFSDVEALLAQAKTEGWTESGKGHLCPIHSPQGLELSKPKRTPKSREEILEPTVSDVAAE